MDFEGLGSSSSGGGRVWQFGQCFGEKENDDFTEADVLSAVRFDESGDYLATGDKGGRIVIFRRGEMGRAGRWHPSSRRDNDDPGSGLSSADESGVGGRNMGGVGGESSSSSSSSSSAGAASASASSSASRGEGSLSSSSSLPPSHALSALDAEYRFFTEFQSHESEFDYLKSTEIDEKINCVAWCKPRSVGGPLFLLSTNDKTLKLWRIAEKKMKQCASMNIEPGRYGGIMPLQSLKVPALIGGESNIIASPRRVYAAAHAYNINSIAVNSDGQTFLSADDLRVNVWDLENAKLSFNVVDIKPPTLEELTEVITSADFHPTHCHIFTYSSSRGTIKLADMRASALCDRHAKLFEEPEDAVLKSYFSEIIASVSDTSFSKDGCCLVSRDYLSVKVWDIRSESRPLHVIPVHEFLRPKMSELYESDCIFDKFEVATAGDGTSLATGSYDNSFKICDVLNGSETTIQLSKTIPRPPVVRPLDAGLTMSSVPSAITPTPRGSAASHASLFLPPYDPSLDPFSAEAIAAQRAAASDALGGLVSPSSSAVSASANSSSSSAASGGGGSNASFSSSIYAAAGAHPMASFSLLHRPPVSLLIPPMRLPSISPAFDIDAPFFNPDEFSFEKKVLHLTWHPFDDIIAIAGINNLYIYYA